MVDKRRTKKRPARKARLTKTQLEDMILDATTDCYNETEQVSGFLVMIEENLKFPFEAEVLGVKVSVEGVEQTTKDQIVAVCTRGGSRQTIPVEELPLPSPAPAGAEWIQAYRYWVQRG